MNKFIIWIVLIAIFILIVFFIYLIIQCKLTNNKIKNYFNNSVIVYGAKGKGKDLLFQKVIYLKRKKEYLSNQNYGYNCHIVPISDLTVEPNTYEHFISGNIKQINKNLLFEGKDYYLSDGGVYLPCQYDYFLNKKYPSFPIFYALSRHLYNMNIHINTQALTRIWKSPREQADKYIHCLGKFKLFNLIFCKLRFYDKYESAEQNLLPMKRLLFNKDNKALVEQYNATNGEIKNGLYVIKTKHIKYDTRAFHNTLFGFNFNKKEWRKYERKNKKINRRFNRSKKS